MTSDQLKNNNNIVKFSGTKNNEHKIESKTEKEEAYEFEVDEDDSNDIFKSRNEERIQGIVLELANLYMSVKVRKNDDIDEINSRQISMER